ncbi:MAG: hypothetical protein U1F39_06715 [Steroidobacteraceae bacterium]
MHSVSLGKGTPDGFLRFVDWCHALLDVEQHGQSQDRHTLKTKGGLELALVRDPSTEVCSVETSAPVSSDILAKLRDASTRAARGDIGMTQWWQVSFATRKALDASFGLNMMRMLGQARGFRGKWRLGRDVLTEFTIDDPKDMVAFSQQKIKATFRCVGPGHGPRAADLARRQSDVIRAVLSFTTASIVEGGEFARPATSEEFPAGSEVNAAISELKVHDILVWSRIAEFASMGATELVSRIVNALTAFEHALHQSTDGAAVMFYVAAIEALTVPNHRYSHLRVSKRFSEAVTALAGPKLVETIEHKNFSEAFESTSKRIKTPKQLADRIYRLRSSPVHSGRFGLERNLMFGVATMGGGMRAALLAEIAEAAILEFLRCPFTSLVGHMDFDPTCRIELTDEEHAIVRAAAHGKSQSIEDYIFTSLGLGSRSAR